MRADGRPGDVHVANRNMDIHHGLNGDRRVDVERADHSRIVAERGARGYVQHPFLFHGREFGHRTYFRNGRFYDRFYDRYAFHGVFVDGYMPAAYFAPAFYGWVYNPWTAPVPYAWGFAGNPWYGYYGFYFAPYPVYASASLWLTDYLVSQSLAADYQARVEAGAVQPPAMAPTGQVVLTPEVKQLISQEVQRQVALENQEAQQTALHRDIDPASSGIARMLMDNVQHVFVVGQNLDVVDEGSGAECAIGEGDVLQLAHAPSANATAGDMVVLTSKGGTECHRGSTVAVGLADLQNMQNHMRETIDQGMNDLKNNQAKGIPAVPASAAVAPFHADFVAQAPPADRNAAAEIGAQWKESDSAEQEALSQPTPIASASPAPTSAGPAPGGAPKTIAIGQTAEDVTAILGQPKSVVDLGAKKIYVYPDIKITFNNGKVSDVQ